MKSTTDEKFDARIDAVVVGAGFGGMYMLLKLREAGYSMRVYETGSGVGGTWFWNRYPGGRCDVESMQYSYSFDDDLQQQWNWSERYSPQAEILKYANHVADRLDLRPHIEFETSVQSATYDESSCRWSVCTSRGQRVSARYLITAVGCLSAANIPEFDGREEFPGNIYHTGHWPHEGVDFTGKRVAVIGTGSSGIQSIPVIAEQAKSLHVFQRTANFAVPARNRALDSSEREAIKRDDQSLRAKARGARLAFTSPITSSPRSM